MVEVGLGGRGTARRRADNGTVVQFREASAIEEVVVRCPTKAIGGLCMETWVYWDRMIRFRKGGGRDHIGIDSLELMAMVMTAYVMVKMKGDIPKKKGAAGMTRAGN